MESVTLLISVLAALLVVSLRPIYGLAIYIFLLFGWSQRLTVPLGPLDFTSGRIVILVLMARVLLSSEVRSQFTWRAMDGWVLIGWLGVVAALSQTTPPEIFLVREAGTLVDSLLPYFAVRLLLRSRQDLFVMIKALVWIGLPLALLGAFQSFTGRNLVGFMQLYDRLPEMRKGFYRANVIIDNSIAFGLFFAAVLPLALGLWHQRVWPRTWLMLTMGVLAMGLMASMSSAPYFALALMMGFLACYPLRRYWPVLLVAMVGFYLFVEIFSNRHAYHVLTRFAFNQATASYRIGLVEEALGGGMSGHWFSGYGYVGIGSDLVYPNFNWEHQDFVNIYVGRLARYGLLGLVPFLVINVLFYRSLVQGWRLARDVADRWLVWCLSGALVGWNTAFMTVGALSQIEPMLFMLIAATGSLPMLLASGEERTVLLVVVRPAAEPSPEMSNPVAGMS